MLFEETQGQDENTIASEIEMYLNTPCISVDIDPLLWWKANDQTFQNLSLMAKKYLCTQATSVSSERVFSTSGDVVDDSRCSLLSRAGILSL